MGHTAGAEQGTVAVAVPVAASVDRAWRALTERDRVEEWFGVLSADLAPGARVRLDFEDGDFFDLEVEEVAEPELRFSWRFMGCGPRDEIAIRVSGSDDGGAVATVTDHEPNRSPEEVAELAKGWEDFMSRLKRHLETGERTRYDWRSDVDVWIELPVDADSARRLVIGSAADWLPLASGTSLLDADAVVLDDGEQPATFAIDGVEPAGPAAVRSRLRPDGMAESLTCTIEVAPRGDGSTLAIGITGFRDLDADDAVRRRIRERFAAAWLAAAWRVRELVGRPVATTGRAR